MLLYYFDEDSDKLKIYAKKLKGTAKKIKWNQSISGDKVPN